MLRKLFKSGQAEDTAKNEQELKNLLKDIENVHKELEETRRIFCEVSDPEVIDHIILKIYATEEKYRYLLKQARKLKLKGPISLRTSGINFHEEV